MELYLMIDEETMGYLSRLTFVSLLAALYTQLYVSGLHSLAN